MSSILDALRKLEKEKTERGEMLSTAVAGDILRLEPCRRQRRWLLPAAIFVILTLVLAAALLLVRPSGEPAPSLPLASAPAAPVVAVPVPRAAPAPVLSLPLDLPVLSGIVYQPAREARMAILNDLPVMEETEIAGYRLHEILADRVVLARAGRLYELRLPTAAD